MGPRVRRMASRVRLFTLYNFHTGSFSGVTENYRVRYCTVTFLSQHGVHGALLAGEPYRDDGRSRCRAGFRVRSYVSRPGRKAF